MTTKVGEPGRGGVGGGSGTRRALVPRRSTGLPVLPGGQTSTSGPVENTRAPKPVPDSAVRNSAGFSIDVLAAYRPTGKGRVERQVLIAR